MGMNPVQAQYDEAIAQAEATYSNAVEVADGSRQATEDNAMIAGLNNWVSSQNSPEATYQTALQVIVVIVGWVKRREERNPPSRLMLNIADCRMATGELPQLPWSGP